MSFEKLAKRIVLNLLKLTKHRNGFVEVYFFDSGTIKKMPLTFRRREFNVLAFPAKKDFPRPDIRGRFLGEIYFNPQYISEKGESFSYLLIHGFLHLLGYDHKKINDRIKMERKEAELLSKISNS